MTSNWELDQTGTIHRQCCATKENPHCRVRRAHRSQLKMDTYANNAKELSNHAAHFALGDIRDLKKAIGIIGAHGAPYGGV